MTKIRIASLTLLLGLGGWMYAEESLPKASLYEVADTVSIPIYPRIAAASGQFGDIKVILEVDSDGHFKVMRIDGKPEFLVEAVRKMCLSWTFLPRRPTCEVVVWISFQLLPSTAKDSELVSEIFPRLNKINIRSRQPNLERGSIVDLPVLKDQ